MATGLLGIADLPRPDIEQLLTRAKDFQPQAEGGYPRLTSCRGKMVVNLFFEASTRTRSSFEIAARHLGAAHVGRARHSRRLYRGTWARRRCRSRPWARACRRANRWWTR